MATSNQRTYADAGSKNDTNTVDIAVDMLDGIARCGIAYGILDEISRNGKLAMTQITFLRSMKIH